MLVEAGEQCTICGVLCDPYETRGLAKLAAETPLEDQGGDLEARVLGAIIARPWLVAAEVGPSCFDDERNRAVFIAIYHVQVSGGPLPQCAADMGLAIMRRIEGTPAAERVDLTYLASLVLFAELALGQGCNDQRAEDWFDGEVDALLARRAA